MERSTSSKIKTNIPLLGMWVNCFMTITDTDEGKVCYGTFPTMTEAYEWAEKLDNAEIVPVYYPAYNRG